MNPRTHSIERTPLAMHSAAAAGRQVALVAGASLFVALCAHVSVPLGFTPVPVSLQPFAVLLVGLLLTPAASGAAMALYLVEGISGMPVFTPQGLGGVAQILGPTGGYLMSYPLAAPLAGWLFRLRSRSFAWGTTSAALASLLILTLGAAWMAMLTHATPGRVLTLSVLPFLPGDALKVVAAAAIAAGWNRWSRRSA